MIGERLTDLRNDKGLTQKELANILHVTNHNISAYERGKNEPPDSVKIAISRFFGVSVDYLLGLTDDPTPYKLPGTTLTLGEDFPSAARPILQCAIRLLTIQAQKDPRTVEKELRRLMKESLALIPEDTEEAEEEE